VYNFAVSRPIVTRKKILPHIESKSGNKGQRVPGFFTKIVLNDIYLAL
jgi:hypothetical protein